MNNFLPFCLHISKTFVGHFGGVSLDFRLSLVPWYYFFEIVEKPMNTWFAGCFANCVSLLILLAFLLTSFNILRLHLRPGICMRVCLRTQVCACVWAGAVPILRRGNTPNFTAYRQIPTNRRHIPTNRRFISPASKHTSHVCNAQRGKSKKMAHRA